MLMPRVSGSIETRAGSVLSAPIFVMTVTSDRRIRRTAEAFDFIVTAETYKPPRNDAGIATGKCPCSGFSERFSGCVSE